MPEKIGRHWVVGELGAGGMGRVYRAYDDTLERAVAIKVLKTDAYRSPVTLARFHREAEILGRVAHPNVVRVFEVGTHFGAPYLVMELVRGPTLREWGWSGRTEPEILDVFIQAGRALAAVHRIGVVHRDFKPDNVIVSRDDGRARVLDFGLGAYGPTTAVTPTSSSPGSRMTETGTVMGTPAYMSPEQHVGGTVDHRSDQFCFCAALFEMLYGHLPFKGRTPGDVCREIVAGNIRLPKERHGPPRQIARALVRGLSLRPRDRWPSMDALLAQLRPRSTRWRRVGIALATSLAGASALAVGIASADAPSPCSAEATVTQAQRDRIEAAANAIDLQGADAVASAALSSADEHALAWTRAVTEHCASEARVEGPDPTMECLGRDLVRFRAQVDALTGVDARTLARAMPAIRGLPDPQRCSDAQAREPSAPEPAEAELRASVTAVRDALGEVEALHWAGRYDDALARAEAVVALARSVGYAPVEAEVQHWKGRTLQAVGRNAEAIATFEHAYVTASGAGHNDLALRLAHALMREHLAGGVTAPARRWLRAAEAWVERAPDQAWARAQHRYQVGAFHRAAREHDLAVDAYRDALRTYAKRGAAPRKLAAMRGELAAALSDAGRMDEAIEQQRRAIEEHEAALGTADLHLAADWANLGSMLSKTEDRADAEPAVRRGIEIYEAVAGPKHPQLGNAYGILGWVLRQQGRLPEAQAALERSSEIHEAVYGPTHAVTLRSFRPLGELAGMRGEIDRAKALFLEELRRLEVAGRGDSVTAGTALLNLARVFRLLDQSQTSLDYLGRALAVFDGAPDSGPPNMIGVLTTRGDVLMLEGRSAEARVDYEEALRRTVEHYGPQSVHVAYRKSGLAYVASREGKHREAEALLEASVLRLEEHFGRGHYDLAAPLAGLATTYVDRGRFADAAAAAERVLAIERGADVFPGAAVQARFALARALWRQRSERPRALSLAQEAVRLADAHAVPDGGTEPRRWLERHGGA